MYQVRIPAPITTRTRNTAKIQAARLHVGVLVFAGADALLDAAAGSFGDGVPLAGGVTGNWRTASVASGIGGRFPIR